MSDHEFIRDSDNNTPFSNINEKHFEILKKQGFSDRMAYHTLSLFLRDPVPAYENELDFKSFSLPCDTNSQESTEEE